MIAMKRVFALVEEGALALSSVNFTHESTVNYFFMIVDLQWIVSSLTLNITENLYCCNRLINGITIKFVIFRRLPPSPDAL